MGCGLKRIGRKDHDEIDAEASPIHLPERCHFGGHIATQNIDGDLIAGLHRLAFDGKNLRVGRKLDFDGKAERFVKDKEADALLTRNYRKPFVVPDKV
jgi:hypothetical protein